MSAPRRAVAALAAAALTVSPAAALAASKKSTTVHTKAVAVCKAQLKKEGKKKFDAKWGKKNALGKCVSAYVKAHSKKKG
jgi:hypothetical protein